MELNEHGRPLRKALPLLLAPTCTMDIDDIPVDQHHVKASFLFNLLRFIEWPNDVCLPKGSLNLCICGAYSLGAFYSLDGARVGGRTVCVQRIKEKDLGTPRIGNCHVLFISGDVPAMTIPISRGLLTVGETERFTACGGVMNLFLIDGRVRFQINDEMAQACGLSIDPRLMSLRMR